MRTGQRSSLESRLQSFSVDQLQDERAEVARSLQAVDGPDVRMTQRCEQVGFALESRQPFGVGREGRRQYFDRHIAVQGMVVRAIDLAHPACTEPRADLVGANPRAN